jgi:quercetin dioxygenase-like cupin family protein
VARPISQIIRNVMESLHTKNYIKESIKMDLDQIKKSIITNVYHIPVGKKISLHKHDKHDEIFYCIKGQGFGVLENSEIELTTGKEFIVPAGIMHALRSDEDLYVTSFLIPVIL